MISCDHACWPHFAEAAEGMHTLEKRERERDKREIRERDR